MPRFKTPAPAPPTPSVRSTSATPIRKRSKKEKIDGLSLVAAFDDLCRNGNILNEGAEKEFLVVVRNAQEWRKKWAFEAQERRRLALLLTDKDNELNGKEYQIKQARKFVEEEQRSRLKVEADRDNLQKQLHLIKDLVFADGGKTLNNETLEKIRTLDRKPHFHYSPAAAAANNHDNNYLAPVEESAESLLDASDLSFDETREDLMDGSMRLRNGHKYHPVAKPRRSSRRSSFANRKSDANNLENLKPFIEDDEPLSIDDIRAKVKRSRQSRDRKVTYDEDLLKTPLQQKVLPETTPTTVKRTFSNAASVPSRPHSFQKKNVVSFEKCNPCGRRIKFGKAVYKCRDCAVVCHIDCKKDVPLPCVAGGNRTPTNKQGNYLADYTPIEAPMIPALLIYCVKEVELRGMEDVGIYRVAGSESDANEILDKFMRRGAGLPKLAKYEIHAVTSCIKKFLRSLKEPIIPLSLWQVFVDAANNPDTTDAETAMYQAISELPQPNRDTLAFLILHLQTIASNSKVNKMNVDNLSMVMGPTIVGNSSNDPMAIMAEATLQKAVVRALMGITADYWSTFLSVEVNNLMLVAKTPSTAQPTTPILTPELPIFTTPLASGVTTGGPARRTRSRQLTEQFSKKQKLFQSPMLL